ncbi:hypothetical protein [Pseudalkalibacillus sp. SCS-8]|uniref:hypothetical protein n=1 Tax=Pseudalkalibacillus nanhaiensis TaxID=3115291 RepID=UPI0032DA8D09
MAFGIRRTELEAWKRKAEQNEIAFLTHYWIDPRFPEYETVTKVGCNDLDKLIEWGKSHGLRKEWIDHHSGYPHYDLLGERQLAILRAEGQFEQIQRFNLDKRVGNE